MTIVIFGIVHGLLPRVCQGAYHCQSVLSVSVVISDNQNLVGFGSVDSDVQGVMSFVFWIGLDRQISVVWLGFGRLDLMLHVAPMHIVGVSQS